MDTDVVEIAVAMLQRFIFDKSWIAFGVGKHLRYVPIHSICKNLGDDASQALVFFPYVFPRQRGSVVSVGDLNAEDPGSNPRLKLLKEFGLGNPRGKFTTLCK